MNIIRSWNNIHGQPSWRLSSILEIIGVLIVRLHAGSLRLTGKCSSRRDFVKIFTCSADGPVSDGIAIAKELEKVCYRLIYCSRWVARDDLVSSLKRGPLIERLSSN